MKIRQERAVHDARWGTNGSCPHTRGSFLYCVKNANWTSHTTHILTQALQVRNGRHRGQARVLHQYWPMARLVFGHPTDYCHSSRLLTLLYIYLTTGTLDEILSTFNTQIATLHSPTWWWQPKHVADVRIGCWKRKMSMENSIDSCRF